MKLFILLVSIPIALLLLAYLVGLFIPESHTATRSAAFNATPEALFALLSGPQDWRDDVEPAITPPNSPRQWRERSRHGSILFEEVTSQPPTLYRTRIADKSLPFAGTWTFQLTPASDNRTTLRITEEGQVHSPLFRTISRYVMGHTRTIDAYLGALSKKLNQPINIEP